MKNTVFTVRIFLCAVLCMSLLCSAAGIDSAKSDNAELGAVFSRLENGDISVCLNGTAGEGASLIFAVYDKNGALSNVKIAPGTTKEYVIANCSDMQSVRVFARKGEGLLIPVASSPGIKTSDIETVPDVLRVREDGQLVHKDGKTVVLRGVNFGGWLIQETWMCPLVAFDNNMTVKGGKENGWANLDTLNALESKFGANGASALMQKYYDSYITEADFKNVRDLGFNCVRIPFWYRNFISDENGTYITDNDDDNPGFKKLDWACKMAGKYGLYLILDMHGCPGGQSGDHSCGKVGRNYLYKEEKYQSIMEELWVRIAKRYRKKTCVAAYDIMNEPLNNANANYGVSSKYAANPWEDKTLRVEVYDRMIKAVRKADPYHVITIEGIWRISYLPDPSDYGWTDMMYQLHSYDSDDSTTKALVKSISDKMKEYGVAGYMGEFNPLVYNKSAAELMDKANISYTLWNYKVTGILSDGYKNWGLYYKSFSADELYNICGQSAFSKVSSSWNGVMLSTKSLTDSEIKNMYSNWWSAEKLATENYTLNNELKAIMGTK